MTAGDRALLDTNILVYAIDSSAVAKQQRSRQLIEELTLDHRLVLSAQILNELYAVATHPKRPYRLPPTEAAQIVRDLADTVQVVPVTKSTTLLALREFQRNDMSFWDALIWAAAVENDITTIYSEDYQHGRTIGGVAYLNPFQSMQTPEAP